MKKINFNNINFINSIFLKEQICFLEKNQIIFVGKSNVGKSSIINSIVNKKIAKTANCPGKTKAINIFNIDEKFYIIDMPGYGYSIASKKQQLKWKILIENFLSINQKNIKLFIYILDIRHSPTEKDLIMIKYLNSIDIPYLILLNKFDKINNIDKHEILFKFKNKLFINQKFENIDIFSIKNNKYRNNIIKKIINSLDFMKGNL